MKNLSLGLPGVGAGPLLKRLAWLTGARLVFASVALALVGLFYLRDAAHSGSFTPHMMLATLTASFAVAGAYAVILRSGRHLERLADVQLVVDQVSWTVVVYLTGGATSGATSFYGLSCLVGASLSGLRGASVAAASGAALYTGLVAALGAGWLPPPSDQASSIYELSAEEATFYLLVNVLVLIVVALLAGTLAERLRWTGGELEAATRRADQAERMAALGRLAAGLAHEIRNPLGSIAGSIQLLRGGAGLSEEDRRLCDIIRREAARLNDLVTDMVDLSKPRRPELVDVDASRVAREVVELAATSGRAASDVTVSYEGEPCAVVRADAAQLRQLVWNLVRNAVQASSAGESVVVAVRLDTRGELQLSVSDHGVGIDEAARERLFDAFFTTRSHGAGIGLALVKRIADEHGFSIQVESSEGRGATFRVNLGPARPEPLSSNSNSVAPSWHPGPAAAAREKIQTSR